MIEMFNIQPTTSDRVGYEYLSTPGLSKIKMRMKKSARMIMGETNFQQMRQ